MWTTSVSDTALRRAMGRQGGRSESHRDRVVQRDSMDRHRSRQQNGWQANHPIKRCCQRSLCIERNLGNTDQHFSLPIICDGLCDSNLPGIGVEFHLPAHHADDSPGTCFRLLGRFRRRWPLIRLRRGLVLLGCLVVAWRCVTVGRLGSGSRCIIFFGQRCQ